MDELERSGIGIRFLKMSAVYVCLGAGIGIYMGIAQDFALTSAHAHVALLGGVGLTVAGLVYTVLPACAVSKLARIHFWSQNLGLPVMIVSLALCVYGVSAAERALGVSSALVALSLCVFAGNLWKNAAEGIRR